MTGRETNRKVTAMSLIGSSGNGSLLLIHKRRATRSVPSVGALTRLGDLAWRSVGEHFGRDPIVESRGMSARVQVALFSFSQLPFTAPSL